MKDDMEFVLRRLILAAANSCAELKAKTPLGAVSNRLLDRSMALVSRVMPLLLTLEEFHDRKVVGKEVVAESVRKATSAYLSSCALNHELLLLLDVAQELGLEDDPHQEIIGWLHNLEMELANCTGDLRHSIQSTANNSDDEESEYE